MRHSAATLPLRAGVDMHVVQRILRHRDVTLITGTYGHLDVEEMRNGLAKMPAMAPLDSFRQAAANDDRPADERSGATQALPDDFGEGPRSEPVVANLRDHREQMAGPTGFVAFGFEGGPDGLCTEVQGGAGACKPLDSGPVSWSAPGREMQPDAPNRTRDATQALPGSPLLTVREVARLLAVSTFTVYGLIDSGRLRCFRISNAVRVRPDDLQAYVRG